MIDNGEDWLKPSPREVKEAMHLLLRLQLFDAATDSLMREIALKQKNVSGNLLRYDKEFASSFIHFLCLNLTFDDYSQRTSPPKNMNQRFINQSTELFKHNFRILVHYLKSIDEVLFNRLAINKTGGTTIFDETKIKTFKAAMRTRTETKNKLKNFGLRLCWSTNTNAMWVHQAFLLQFIVREIDVLLQDNITKNDKLKKFLGLPSSDDCGGRLNLVVWNGQILYTKP